MKKALFNYLQGVKARAPQLVWLLIAMLAILTLNNLVLRSLLSKSTPYPVSYTHLRAHET